MKIRPQPGPQMMFCQSSADIGIFGGAAGPGKTFALLIEPLRHIHNPLFGGQIFRRTAVQIKHEGSLWDTSETLYPLFGGRGYSHNLVWRFPSGATISMNGIEHENDKYEWQSAQLPYMAFDELTHFSKKTFWYMFSRNRSTCGVQPYIRGACNPDPDSWVKEFIQWYLQGDRNKPGFGLPIPGRAGVLRWFVRDGDRLHWGFSAEELKAKFGLASMPLSLTFIPGKVHDNPILMQKDPSYLAKLMALPAFERAQLLEGNWEIRATAGDYFPRGKIEIVDAAPANFKRRVRYWDRAATPKRATNDPDATAGVLMSEGPDGLFYVEHVEKMYAIPAHVTQAMMRLSKLDGEATEVSFMQDPGSAGVNEAQETAKLFAGRLVSYATATGSKKVRAKPFSAQWIAGNVRLVRGQWNSEYIRVMENFTGDEGESAAEDDEVDGSSGAFERLTSGRNIFLV